MPTKQSIKVTRSKDPKRARVSLSFEFSIDDPQATQIFRALGLCLKELLTEPERVEFMRKFELERAKLAVA